MEDLPLEIITEIFQYLHRTERRDCALVCKQWHLAARHPKFFGTLRLHQELHPLKIRLPEFYHKMLPFKKIIFEYVYSDDVSDGYLDFWDSIDHSGIKHVVFEGCICLTSQLFEDFMSHFRDVQILEIERKQSLGESPLNIRFDYLRQLRLENVFMNMKQIMTLVQACTHLTFLSVSDNIKDRFGEYPYPSMLKYVKIMLDHVDTVELHVHNYYDYDIELMQNVENLMPGLKIGFFRIPRNNLPNEKVWSEILKFMKAVKRIDLLDICVLEEVKQLENVLQLLDEIPKLELEVDLSVNLTNLSKLTKGKGMKKFAIKTIGACYFTDNFEFPELETVFWIGPLFPITLDSLLAFSPKLTELDVSGISDMNDERIQVIFKNCLKLKALNISDCPGITEDGLTGWKMISQPDSEDQKSTYTGHLLKNLTELETFKANRCGEAITDRVLAICFHFKYLTEVQLYSATKITNNGLSFLLENCPNLEKLGIIGCEGLSPDCISLINCHLKYLKALLLPKNDGFLFTEHYFNSLKHVRELNYTGPRV
uniref:CSON001001 protein n=1 Tax=Culicoides sonorensis TaxID=179676 RepID=A0A336KVT3_CULSO